MVSVTSLSESGTKAHKTRVPKACIARLVGVSRRTIYNVIDGCASPKTTTRIAEALTMYGRGEFRFERRARKWVVIGDRLPTTDASRKPYTRRVKPNVVRGPTAEDVVRAVRHAISCGQRVIKDIARAVGLPTVVINQAGMGRMRSTTQTKLVEWLKASKATG